MTTTETDQGRASVPGTDARPAPVRPTADRVRVLEPQAEWRASDVSDVDAWTLHLSDDQLAELDEALAHARSVT
ncbi:hypothetical protein I6F37_40390, partial [Bradyrhizobium sp. NBAIM08]|nr:hypothetical protein [Bradyrhizobium sp. NBAIM08]